MISHRLARLLLRILIIVAALFQALTPLSQSVAQVYDGDGNRVKVTEAGVTTLYPGQHYEYVDDTTYTKYYYAGSDLIAFERSPGYGTTAGYGRRFVLRDHLGSTNVIVNGQGNTIAQDLYLPFGDVRYQWRSGTPAIATQTQYRYTGQRLEAGVGAPSPVGGLDRGLYFYGARWYDASLARFVQPDTIVPEPGNPQSLSRYTYVLNNPIRYTDPTGSRECDASCRDEQTTWEIIFGSAYLGQWDPAQQQQNTHAATQVSSVLLDFAPGVGDLKGLIEVFTGRDLVTGEALGNWRWAGLLFASELRGLRHGDEVANVVGRAIKSEIKPARELLRERVPNTDVHHLIEQRFARQFGVKPGDLPAIRLDKTFHQQEVTARLFRGENLPTYPPRQYDLQKIWNTYSKVYGDLGRQDWLDAIWPYFERLGGR